MDGQIDRMNNGAPRRGGAQVKTESEIEAANKAASAASSLLGMFQAPAANGFLLTQKLALESARFWARRMHAYADQMEALARCANPKDLAAANSQFIDRMREDYTQERVVLSEIVIMPKTDQAPGDQPRA